MPTVKIDPRYWETVKKEYTNWRFSWAREAGQNSLDAGATVVDITVDQDGDDTLIVWTDNGCGMSKDVLLNRFLAIGGSQKASGNTGGFGVAKSLLAFAQRSYQIRTGTLRLTGKGSEYELKEGCPKVAGTTLSVLIGDTSSGQMTAQIRRWVRWSTTKTTIKLNGEKLKSLVMPKVHRASLPWARIYVHNNTQGFIDPRIRVRVNGQYMFDIWSDAPKDITVDITGKSSDFLTANRDSLNWRYQDALTKTIAEIFRDPSKITNNDDDVITFYQGSKGEVPLGTPKVAKVEAKPIGDKDMDTAALIDAVMVAAGRTGRMSINQRDVYERGSQVRNGHDLVILNNLNRDPAEKWLPGSMSDHAKDLMRRWTAVLQFCAPLCEVNEHIRVGWVFNTKSIAAYKKTSQYGHLLLLNPTELQKNRLKQRWNKSARSFYNLVATAVHELTHVHYRSHNESYASALTDNMARVLANGAALEALRQTL